MKLPHIYSRHLAWKALFFLDLYRDSFGWSFHGLSIEDFAGSCFCVILQKKSPFTDIKVPNMVEILVYIWSDTAKKLRFQALEPI